MKKHFVEFLSPGTLFAETTEKPIPSWDIELAKQMAREIKERYNATPYGFRFLTRSRGNEDLDSKVTKASGIYFLGGDILTLEDVKRRNDPKDHILISNMEYNHFDRILENRNSWKSTHVLRKGDVVLQWP